MKRIFLAVLIIKNCIALSQNNLVQNSSFEDGNFSTTQGCPNLATILNQELTKSFIGLNEPNLWQNAGNHSYSREQFWWLDLNNNECILGYKKLFTLDFPVNLQNPNANIIVDPFSCQPNPVVGS